MPTDGAGLDELASAHLAFDEWRWEDAFAHFVAADAEHPLASADLELLSRAAELTRHDAVAAQALERAYAACLAEHAELRAARVAFWHGYRLASLGESGRAEAWLGRSEQLVNLHGECAERGYLFLPRIHHLIHHKRYEEAHAAALAAMAIGDRFADADLSALARQLGGRALVEAGHVTEGMRLLGEAMLIATTSSVTELSKGLVYCAVIASCQRVFAVDRAREWTAVLEGWCRMQEQLGMFSGTCRVHRAELMKFGGLWADALEEARQVTSGLTADDDGRASAFYEQAEIYRLRGDHQAAERAYERASALGGEPQPGLALLRLDQGRLDIASGAISRAVVTSRTDLGRARFLPAQVEIMLAAGKSSDAHDAARELAAIAARYDTPVLQAMSAQARGLTLLDAGNPEEALPALRLALHLWLSLSAPYVAARVRVGLAAACGALGDTEGARLELAAARETFAALVATPDLERLAPEHQVAAGAGLLSGQELRVLRLAANGETNKQIATRLQLSVRTVDRHVSNILAKLAVPSRAAATAYAYENGLIQR